MADDPKAVLAALPSPIIQHPVKLKSLRTQWDKNCSRILGASNLSREAKINVIMGWLKKAGLFDFVLGEQLLTFAKPLPVPPTEDKRKERRQRAFVRLAYTDDIPHVRAVTNVMTERLQNIPVDTRESLKSFDSVQERELAEPGTMFAEFAQRIEELVTLQYSGEDTRVAAE